jgi:hypothetical protein
MVDNILLLIIFFILMIILFQKSENMTDYNFGYFNSKSSLFLSNNLYSINEQIEIKLLQECNLNIKYDYGTNYNSIINNGISVYQDVADPLIHTIEIDNINYNLTSIRWKNSKLSYNNKSVGLNLELTHQNFNSIYKVILVIPLNFINYNLDNKNNETFKNIGYNYMTKDFNIYTDTKISDNSNKNFITPSYFQLKDKKQIIINSQKKLYNLDISNNNINKKYSLNKLLTSPVLIPDYECCVNSIGQNLRFNFCDIQQILQSQKKFYRLEDKEANNYFIIEPQEFNEEIGLDIMNKIFYDNYIFYIKR